MPMSVQNRSRSKRRRPLGVLVTLIALVASLLGATGSAYAAAVAPSTAAA
jgi:hypothetical protein